MSGLHGYVLAIVVAIATPVAAQNGGTIAGTVTDASGVAIADAQVVLSRPAAVPLQVQTDSLGKFAFANLDPGKYRISVSAIGFQSRSITDALADAAFATVLPPIVLDVALIEAGCPAEASLPTVTLDVAPAGRDTAVQGEVSDGHGSPVKKANVTVMTASGRVVAQTSTAVDGGFTVHNVPPGNYRLRIWVRGRADFIMDSAPVRLGHRTTINQPLVMYGCPQNVRCKPTHTVEVPVLCL